MCHQTTIWGDGSVQITTNEMRRKGWSNVTVLHELLESQDHDASSAAYVNAEIGEGAVFTWRCESEGSPPRL